MQEGMRRMHQQTKILEAVQYIKQQISTTPTIGLILGSGLGALADLIEDAQKIQYENIPYFPVSTVEGHVGQLVCGQLEGKSVVAMQGRFHYYEGYPMNSVTFAVRVMKMLGIDTLIVTNAAGGINTSFGVGDLMIITDHINFSGNNPLIGENLSSFGVRFPDLSQAYNKELVKLAQQSAGKNQISIQHGVYLYVTGPSYETPAEIRMFRILGADAVGMSTVPETIVANHCGMRVLGISCITNMAAGILEQPLNHQEVIETSASVQKKFITLIKSILCDIE